MFLRANQQACILLFNKQYMFSPHQIPPNDAPPGPVFPIDPLPRKQVRGSNPVEGRGRRASAVVLNPVHPPAGHPQPGGRKNPVVGVRHAGEGEKSAADLEIFLNTMCGEYCFTNEKNLFFLTSSCFSGVRPALSMSNLMFLQQAKKPKAPHFANTNAQYQYTVQYFSPSHLKFLSPKYPMSTFGSLYASRFPFSLLLCAMCLKNKRTVKTQFGPRPAPPLACKSDPPVRAPPWSPWLGSPALPPASSAAGARHALGRTSCQCWGRRWPWNKMKIILKYFRVVFAQLVGYAKQEQTLFKDLRRNKQYFVQRKQQNDNCWKTSVRIPPRCEFVETKSIEGWVRHWGDPTPKEIVSGRWNSIEVCQHISNCSPPQQEQEQLPQF